jgi:hypothetical protein
MPELSLVASQALKKLLACQKPHQLPIGARQTTSTSREGQAVSSHSNVKAWTTGTIN